jgi:hypothetical protein
MCDLCLDSIDKPHVDADGTKRVRACPNVATRQVVQHGKKDRLLNICEEHFAKEAS